MSYSNNLRILSLIGLAIFFTACSIPSGNRIAPIAPPATHTPEITASPRPSPTTTASPTHTALPPEFDGPRAYADVERQVAFGPRLPGSQAHAQVVDWLQAELGAYGWSVELQETTYLNQPVKNVIARRGTDQAPWIILGAHFDSRFTADQDPDPDRRADPVPGANDGASGVAVLVELARILPDDLNKQIWLVFFDAEDQGRIPGWDWILGSRAFVEQLSGSPDSVIIVDMIGDADLNIYKERNSDPELTDEIWQAAAEQGHANVFIPDYGYSILDDHTPFLEKGLRAIDIIDFDYPYWHTVEDTPDKVSGESLQAVGDTLLYWLTKP